MPIVEEDLGEIQLYGWVFSAFYMGTLIGVVLGGNAVDRVRPIGPMMVGVAIFMVGLTAGGLAPNMDALVAARFTQGLGAGVVPAVSYVVVARGFPEVLHPKVFAAMSAAWVTPALISPLLASVIARHVGWRWVFLGLLPITAGVAAIGGPAVARVKDAPTVDQQRPRNPLRSGHLFRVLALTLGATAAIVGMGQDNLIMGMVIAVTGVVVMMPAFRSLTPPGTLAARPRLPAAILIRGLLTYSFFSSDAFLSLAVTTVRHRSTIYAGFALVGSSVAWSVGSWLQSRYFARPEVEPSGGHVPEPDLDQDLGLGSTEGRGNTKPARGAARRVLPTRLVTVGAVLLVVGASGLIASLNQSVPIALWVISSTTMGLGMGLSYTTISVVTLAEAETGKEGAATSSLQLSDILGTAMGTGVAGVLVALGARWADDNAPALAGVFGVSAAMAALVVVLAPRLSRALPG